MASGSGKAVATRDAAPVPVFSETTIRQFAEMATMIPESEGSGSERILLAILNADNWDALDDPWDTEAADELIGVEQSIYEIMRRPSRFADGLGMFLVIRSKLVGGDKEFVWTSSSVSVVGQLVRAYALDALPLVAILRKADQPTANGYYPQHLEIVASAGNGQRRDKAA
jgi:hypothetical protein